jgi:CubicO group peptidase (beta-lactamase class C family)
MEISPEQVRKILYLSGILGFIPLMKIWLLPLLICLSSLTSQGQGEGKEPLSDALRYIDAWLEAQQVYDQLPGISVAIVRDQELLWTKGYGYSDVKKKVPATPETIYSICSITKLFTSIAIMQLYEQGKLRLDDSLSSLLPDRHINQQFSDSGPITIRSLLTHSSGLPRESDFPYWTGPEHKFPSREQLAEKLDQQETLFPASTYFHYSNLGMALLGEVVERTSGKPYDVYVQENILKPLRLTTTFSKFPQELLGSKLATGYSSITRNGTRDLVPLFEAQGMQAAVGYTSTVEDLARFASWQFRLLNNGGKEILKASTLKDMHRVHWVDPDWKVHWGLGFLVFQQNGKTLTGHSGNCPGYRSTLVLDPEEKLGFVVLINTMENPWLYANQIRNIVLKGAKEAKHKSNGINLDEYTGVYNAQPMGSEKKVLPWYGHLAILNLPSENPLEDMILLQHVSGDVFRRIRREDTLGEEVRFERDEKTGKITRMWKDGNYSMKLK